MNSLERMTAAIKGEPVFLFSGVGGAFSHCFRSLTFEGLYESLVDNPALVHAITELQVDALQTESSLKGYCNDIAEYRTLLGDSICILGNSCIRDVIENGDENTWRADAEQQSRATGAEGRFAICAGSPTTHATPPQRLRAWGRFMQDHIPPRTAMGGRRR